MNNKLIDFMTYINSIFKNINNDNVNSSLKLRNNKISIHDAIYYRFSYSNISTNCFFY